MVDRITGPVEIVNAILSGSSTYFPAGSVTNTAFSSSTADRLDATKANHQKQITYSDETTDTVAAREEVIHVAQGAGTIVAAYIVNETSPTGGDLDYTVDLKVCSDGATSFTTILSSAIASPADGTVGSGTLSTTTYSQYDRFLVDINTSGSTGTQGLGLTVTLILNEAPS